MIKTTILVAAFAALILPGCGMDTTPVVTCGGDAGVEGDAMQDRDAAPTLTCMNVWRHFRDAQHPYLPCLGTTVLFDDFGCMLGAPHPTQEQLYSCGPLIDDALSCDALDAAMHTCMGVP